LLLVALSGNGIAAQQRELSHTERFSGSRERLEDVERDATAALARDPNDADALLARARARLQLGKIPEGLADFERASTVAPERADVRGQRALAHIRLGRWADAKFAADAALALDAENPSAHYAMGLLLLAATTDLTAAIQHLGRASASGPAAPEIRFDLLRAYVRAGDRVRATVQMRMLRGLLPPADARVIHSEGLLAALNGKLDLAVSNFRKTPLAKPPLPFAPLEGALAMGRAMQRQGQANQALALFQEAARRFPESVEAHHELAKAYEQAGRGQEAQAEFATIQQLARKFGIATAPPAQKKPKP
jgi:tetratricopeptide (TPR) repeat protein